MDAHNYPVHETLGSRADTNTPCSVTTVLYAFDHITLLRRFPLPSNFASQEWDATVLELHEFRTALHKTRQELSHALYQHDAATRVIARLLQERDSYRAAAEAGAAVQNGKREIEPTADKEDEEEAAAKRPRGGISGEVVEALTSASAALSKARKKRVVRDTVASPEEVRSLHSNASFPIHKTRHGGITSLDVAPDAPSLVASAGGDSTVQLYDVVSARSVAALVGHTKRVNDVAFAGSSRVVLSASADSTVRVWRATEEDGANSSYATAVALESAAEVVAIAAHPTLPYALSAAADGSWAFDDIAAGSRLATVHDEESTAYSAAGLHPDGLILVTGTSQGAVKVWETRTQKRVAEFAEHTAAIAGLSFSENGYYMATAAGDGVRLWDLRKLKNFAYVVVVVQLQLDDVVNTLVPFGNKPRRTLTPFGDTVPATCVSFDHSGLFLAVGGPEVKIFGAKQEWSELATISGFPKKVRFFVVRERRCTQQTCYSIVRS